MLDVADAEIYGDDTSDDGDDGVYDIDWTYDSVDWTFGGNLLTNLGEVREDGRMSFYARSRSETVVEADSGRSHPDGIRVESDDSGVASISDGNDTTASEVYCGELRSVLGRVDRLPDLPDRLEWIPKRSGRRGHRGIRHTHCGDSSGGGPGK